MTPISLPQSDFVTRFHVGDQPVVGRLARLGPGTIDPILKRHDYPKGLARILSEALALAVLVGSALKFQGRVLVQAEGDGVVSMLVGEYRSDGSLRAYARFDADRWARLEEINKGEDPHMPQLFGRAGRLGLIIIHDTPGMQPYQGLVPLERATLAECAEAYFYRSEQVPTHLKLAVRQTASGSWQAGGALIQRMAGDEARGDTAEAWNTAGVLFETLTEDELLDPALPGGDLLFRLFHEQGISTSDSQKLDDRCSCNEERLRQTLSAMPDDELHELVEPDGTLKADCQFCGRVYRIPIADVTADLN